MTNGKSWINDLPELPIEVLCLGGVLESARTEPVLTIIPKEPAEPDKPHRPSKSDTAQICRASSYYVRRYITQVTYPKVICYPVTAISDPGVKQIFMELENKKEKTCEEIDLPQMQYYKLSNFQNKRLANPYFCTVHAGPWLATVYETQSCSCDASATRWQLFVSNLPELELVWYGVWEDIPSDAYPNLGIIINDIYKTNETTFCCSGYKWCSVTQSCIPNTVTCREPIITGLSG